MTKIEEKLKEYNIWRYLKNCNKPIIIYGMGNGADKVLKLFDHYGITCSGITASDDFVRGQKYRDFTVKKLSYFKEKYEDFIIALAFGTQIPEVMEHIKNLSYQHTILVPNVPVFGDEVFDDAFIEKNAEKIWSAYNLLKDSRSKAVFENAIKFYYSGKLEYLWNCTDHKNEVFNNVLCLTNKEYYIDLGAYRGDTIQELISYGGGYNKIIALEPDPKNYKKLTQYISDKNNITAYQKTIWRKNCTLLFANQGGRNSAIGFTGTAIKAVTVDHLAEEMENVTYIKMDVEGAEKQAICGAVKTLSEKKPKLNIAAYHTFEDLFDLILLIHSINPEYQFYLRHHPYIPLWDTNLYCI
ncbi:MAG: FkbM family methyltransferase [Acutalibacteraceae bacterium]